MLEKLRLFLLPLNLLYGIVVFLRNKSFDWGLLKSTEFNLPVICIGNLAVGGSGKTPTTEYLVNLLSAKYHIAILSRGYGRKTKGFVLANDTATVETIGDEPLQYFRKFKNVTVAVCEDRVKGIKQLKDKHDLILLDDAYQHRSVKAGYNILLFEYAKLLTCQTLLPAGNLRETFSGTKRAQTVIVTKSPQEIPKEEAAKISDKLELNRGQELTFSHIKYLGPIHLYNKTILSGDRNIVVFMLSGIANPRPFSTYLQANYADVLSFEYPDHHQFTSTEIRSLVSAFEQHPAREKIIITTEKDGQRLLNNNLKDLLLNLPVYYLPITIEFSESDKAKFDQNILDYVARAKRFN
jgi:tetraacyldisaccharide 4'-kinase